MHVSLRRTRLKSFLLNFTEMRLRTYLKNNFGGALHLRRSSFMLSWLGYCSDRRCFRFNSMLVSLLRPALVIEIFRAQAQRRRLSDRKQEEMLCENSHTYRFFVRLTHFLCPKLSLRKFFSVGHGHDVDFESNKMSWCGWKNANVKNTNREEYIWRKS